MKKTLSLVALALLLLGSLYSQSRLSFEDPQMDAFFANKANIPVIKGRLLNCTKADLDTLSIRYVLVVPTPERQSMRYADLKKDGSFEIKLDYAIPYQQIWLILPFIFSEVIANKDLYIEADIPALRNTYNMHLEKGTTPPYGQGLVFRGTDAAINRMKNQYNNYDPEAREEFYKLHKIAWNNKLSITERNTAWTQAFAVLEAMEQRFLEQHPFEEGWILENERKSEYYGYLFIMHRSDRIPQGDTLKAAFLHKPYLVSNDGNSYYRYLSYLLSNPPKGDILGGLAKVNFSPRKADLVKIIGGPEGLYEREAYIEKMLPTMQSNWCKELIQLELASKKQQTAQINATIQSMPQSTSKTSLGKSIGSLPQGANLYVAEEENIDSLVQRIRALYPQQAIIIDVWATWCAPCIDDIKNSKPTKEKLKELPVKVVYLCVNSSSTEDKWKKKVAELGVDGDHIWLSGKLSTAIMERYGLAGYPSYLFIDPKGVYHPKMIQSIQYLDIEGLKKRL